MRNPIRLFATTLLLLPLACAEYEEEEPDEFRSAPVCSGCQYKTATFTLSSAELAGGRVVSAIARTDVEHTGTCPYAGYNAPCVASVDFDVSCLIAGPGTYSIGYSPNGLKTSGGSTPDQDTVITVVGDTTKSYTKPLNLGNPTTIVQPTTFPCGGEVEIDIAD